MSSAVDFVVRHHTDAGSGGHALASVSILTIRPGRSAARPDVFAPATDVYETTDGIVVRMEIAGAVMSEVRILLDTDERRLIVRGTRHDPAAGDSRRYYNMEIQCGDFGRDIALPAAVDPEAAVARYEDGFLVIKLRKCAPPVPQRRAITID